MSVSSRLPQRFAGTGFRQGVSDSSGPTIGSGFWSNQGMVAKSFRAGPKAHPGDRVAMISPASAAPAISPTLHEQAMRRLTEATGLIPVEYPTTRQLGASAEARAADVTEAFADPSIRAVLATIGGDDQVTVIPHIDARVLAANPKPFLGYSDNTNLHNLLWNLGVPSFYGGSTQVHLGPGPHLDDIHVRSLRAALLDGGTLELTEPGESEDFGWPWEDPRSLLHFGAREATEPWTWVGPEKAVSGRSWGGGIEVIDQIVLAGRMPMSLTSTGRFFCWRPAGRGRLRPRSSVGYAPWASVESSASLPVCLLPDRRLANCTHPCPRPRSEPVCARRNGTPSSSKSSGTTPTRWSASGCRSGTPVRSGSSHMAAPLRSTEHAAW